MLKKFCIAVLLVIALGIAACGQIQLPASLAQLPQLPAALQTDAAPNPASGTTPDAPQQTAPGTGPQTGRNPGKGAQVPGALAQVFHQLGWEAGVVAKTSSNQIGLRTVKNVPDKVAIGSSTIFIIPGKSGATISDIHVGDRIIADVPNDQTTASLVMGVPKDYDKDNLLLGLVQSNSNGLVTLRTRGGPDTLTTNGATQVIKVLRQGIALGDVSDLQNGNLVVAIGQSSGDAFAAEAVFALPKGALELGRKLGGERKNPPQPPAAKPDN